MQEIIGRGGMGVVLKAALKLNPSPATSVPLNSGCGIA